MLFNQKLPEAVRSIVSMRSSIAIFINKDYSIIVLDAISAVAISQSEVTSVISSSVAMAAGR